MAMPGNKKIVVKTLYLLTFLTALHYAFIAYINSSYLSSFIAKENLGIVYALASAITILIISLLPKALRRWGQFRTILTVLTVDLAAILTLTAVSSPQLSGSTVFPVSDGAVSVAGIGGLGIWIPVAAIISFLIFQTAIVLNRILLDVYLEEVSKSSETGKDRGWSLTAMNAAFVCTPLIIGAIIDGTTNGFWKIYLISSAFLTLSLILIATKLSHIKDVEYHSPPFLQTAKKLSRNKNLLNIYLSSFLLEFFYSWMVIYTPIYLYERIGFSWSQIGIIFSVMLTTFVILEIPLGHLADKYIGEKEILTAGFIIMGVSTAALTFINSASVLVWSLTLFATRIGASAVEVMNDTYFFKKVKASDADIIGFFRNASPVAYIIAPAFASLILYFLDYKYLFAILGAIMIAGVKFSSAIEDTNNPSTSSG